MCYFQLSNFDSALFDNDFFNGTFSYPANFFSGYPVFALLAKLSQQECFDSYINISFHFLSLCTPAIALLQILMHSHQTTQCKFAALCI
jgi:hypothetical protein